MKKTATNTFVEGLKTDLGSYQTGNKVLTGAVNMRRLSNGNDELTLQSEAGTRLVGQLSAGFTALQAAAYGGIAYIVSYNALTGESEVGTFPSPGAGGLLEPVYLPLQNYCADGNLRQPGNFRSVLFGYSPVHYIDMQLQPSYDGTVNIILADGQNPARLINSRFSSPDGTTYEIVDRQGKDSNLYAPEHFQTTLNLIQRSDRLLQTQFSGVSAGGSLRAGTYRLYFRYATADGNMTDVVAETGNVPVFFGDTLGTVRGGHPDEPTDKRIQFQLDNLDESFAFLEVYYSLAAGSESAATEVRHVLNRYAISGPSLLLTLTGFEQTEVVSVDELSTAFASIASFQTIAQVQNRLFPAGAREKQRAYELLERFCRKVYLSHKLSSIPVVHGNNVERLFNTSILDKNMVPGTDGWQGGYANPMNVYHRTGYFGGEAYPHALAFIFPDGSLSPGIPVVGYDDVLNNIGTSFSGSHRAAQVDAALASEGFDAVTGVNSKVLVAVFFILSG